MKKGILIALIVAFAMILGGFILVAVAAAKNAGDALKDIVEDSDSVETESVTYPVKGEFNNITVTDAMYDIKVSFTEDGSCYVETKDSADIYHSVKVEDGRLKITYTDSRKWYRRIFNFGFFTAGELPLNLYIPRGEYGDISIHTASGDVIVEDGLTFANVEINSASGNVGFYASAANLTLSSASGSLLCTAPSGDMYLSSASGTIYCEGESDGAAVIHNASGDVRVENFRPRSLEISTASGDVTLNDTDVKTAVEIDTASGDVSFKRFNAASALINTVSGDVSGSVTSVKNFLPSTVSGSIRIPDSSSSGDRFEIETTSGDITVTVEN